MLKSTMKFSKLGSCFSYSRLDFDNFIIAAPTTGNAAPVGVCAVDTFVPFSPSGFSPPTICGTNSGSHSMTLSRYFHLIKFYYEKLIFQVYLETASSTPQSGQITFNLAALATPTTRRTWKVNPHIISLIVG